MEEKLMSLQNSIKVIDHIVHILNVVNIPGIEPQQLNCAAHKYMETIRNNIQGEYNKVLNEKKKLEVVDEKKNEIKDNI